jgi:RNA polymerase sigma-70 factor (ECF subfamily)
MNQQYTFETGTIPDKEIIKRVLLGEKNLFSLIVRKYNQRLFRVGMSMVNDSNDTEDIMQTTLYKCL